MQRTYLCTPLRPPPSPLPVAARRGPAHLRLQRGAQRSLPSIGRSRPSSARVAPASVRAPTLSKPVTPSPPRSGWPGVPHSTGGAGGIRLGKKSAESRELRGLFRSWEGVWLPGDAPCLNFGSSSESLLPAVGCGVRRANWKDPPALREPPGTAPRAHSHALPARAAPPR